MFKLTVVFETKADAETAQRFVLDSIKTSGNVMRAAVSASVEELPALVHGDRTDAE